MKKKTIALCLVLTMFLGVFVPLIAKASAIEVERIAGDNRYETAVKISQKEFTISDNVILASGENFADALAGGQLAVILEAPILLTTAKNLNDDVKTEIGRLNAKKVFILGGKNTISEDVENQVREICEVERISGNNRIETAIKIIEKARSLGLTNDTIFADAYNFPDALAAGTLIAAKNYSLALSEKQEVPNITTGKELVLGGVSSLPLPGYTGERIAGDNRYQTAFNLASFTYPGVDFISETIVLVDGTNYPDALSAISIAKANNAPILLTNPKALDQEVKKFILERVVKVIIVGGENSVSEEVVSELNVDSDLDLPKITKQPTWGEAKVGEYVELSLKAEGKGLTYQWKEQVITTRTPNIVTQFIDVEEGANNIGVNTPTLKVKVISRDELLNSRLEQEYICYVKDENGNGVYTNPVRVYPNNVINYYISNDLQPWEGEKVVLTVDAWGDVPIGYQWQYKKDEKWVSIPGDSKIYSGAYSNEISFIALESLSYNYRCVLESPNAQTVETVPVIVEVFPQPVDTIESNALKYISKYHLHHLISITEIYKNLNIKIEGPNDEVGKIQGYGATFKVDVKVGNSTPQNIKYQWQYKKYPWYNWEDIKDIESDQYYLSFRIKEGSEHQRYRCKIIINNGEPIFSREAKIIQKLHLRGPEPGKIFYIPIAKFTWIGVDATGDGLKYKWSTDKEGLDEIESFENMKYKGDKRSGHSWFVYEDSIGIFYIKEYNLGYPLLMPANLYCHITDKYGDKAVAGPYKVWYTHD